MAKKRKTAARKASAVRIAPFVPTTVRLGRRDILNQVLNDATWTVVTPDWAKWVQTKDDGTWVSNPATFKQPTIRVGGARAKRARKA